MSERVKPIEEEKLVLEPFSNGFHDAAERPSSTGNSSSQSTTVDDTPELCQGLVASSNASVPIQAVNKAKVIPKYSYVRWIGGSKRFFYPFLLSENTFRLACSLELLVCCQVSVRFISLYLLLNYQVTIFF